MEDFVVMNYVVVVVVEKPKIVEESGNHADQSYQSQVCCLTPPCFWSKGRGGKTQTKIDPIGGGGSSSCADREGFHYWTCKKPAVDMMSGASSAVMTSTVQPLRSTPPWIPFWKRMDTVLATIATYQNFNRQYPQIPNPTNPGSNKTK